MLDSIHVGMTGLQGYAKGLRVIANNTANMNTPGFKGAALQFADLYYAPSGSESGAASRLGQGLGTTGTRLDFRQGDLRQTGNEFDLGVEGEGLFVLRSANGELRYTRAGQFEFDAEGVLVNRLDDSKVLGQDEAGRQVEFSLEGLRTVAGKATTSARFTGNLSSTMTEHTVNGVKVFDALGKEHQLSIKFTASGEPHSGTWDMELLEGETSIGTAQITFADGRPTAASAKPVFTYTAAGQPAVQLSLDFSTDTTSFASGTLSSLGMASQDGRAPGSLSRVAFDAEGRLVASYSNGETVKGARLLLAAFDTPDAVEAVGGNQFTAANGIAWRLGTAGSAGFGTVRAGVLEASNVDLSREFSELVILQRGYQASSQVVGTANEMLQELFRMKAK